MNQFAGFFTVESPVHIHARVAKFGFTLSCFFKWGHCLSFLMGRVAPPRLPLLLQASTAQAECLHVVHGLVPAVVGHGLVALPALADGAELLGNLGLSELLIHGINLPFWAW